MKKMILTILGLLSAQISQADDITFAIHKNLNFPAVFLFLASDPNTKITVTQPDGSIIAQPVTDSNGNAEVTGLESFMLDTIGKNTDKAITISSPASVSAYVANSKSTGSDASFLINNSRLGKEYYIPAWYDDSLPSSNSAQLSITALEDDTHITIISPVALSNAGFSANTATPIALNKGETYFIAENVDFSGTHISSDKNIAVFSGTHISSDKNIAVFSGHECTSVGSDNTCNHLYSQIIPTSMAGTHYLVSETRLTYDRGNFIRIIATKDNTDLIINNNGTTSTPTMTSAADFYDIDSAYDVEITATNPVIVVQYLKAKPTDTDKGASSMTVIPPTTEWIDSYYYASPDQGTFTYSEKYIDIIIEKNTAGKANVALNGVAVSESEFSDFGVNSDYLRASISIINEDRLGDISADQPFQINISGFSQINSFLMAGAIGAPASAASTDALPIPSTGQLSLLIIALLLMISTVWVIQKRYNIFNSKFI